MTNNWHVSDEGSDDNDCQTESAPCKNLQSVLDRASDGTDIYVTSDTLSLDAVHGKFRYPMGYMVDCCEVNSSISYNISRLNGTRFNVSCSSKLSEQGTQSVLLNLAETFGKITHLKIAPKAFMSIFNSISDVSRKSPVFTELTHFPQDVSKTHTSFHSTEL